MAKLEKIVISADPETAELIQDIQDAIQGTISDCLSGASGFDTDSTQSVSVDLGPVIDNQRIIIDNQNIILSQLADLKSSIANLQSQLSMVGTSGKTKPAETKVEPTKVIAKEEPIVKAKTVTYPETISLWKPNYNGLIVEIRHSGNGLYEGVFEKVGFTSFWITGSDSQSFGPGADNTVVLNEAKPFHISGRKNKKIEFKLDLKNLTYSLR